MESYSSIEAGASPEWQKFIRDIRDVRPDDREGDDPSPAEIDRMCAEEREHWDRHTSERRVDNPIENILHCLLCETVRELKWYTELEQEDRICEKLNVTPTYRWLFAEGLDAHDGGVISFEFICDWFGVHCGALRRELLKGIDSEILEELNVQVNRR